MRSGALASGVVAATFLVVGTSGAALAAAGSASAAHALDAYNRERQTLSVDLRAAAAQGYGPDDLRSVTSALGTVGAGSPPWWPPSRADYYRQQSDQIARLRTALAAREQQVLQQAQSDAGKQVGAAQAAIQQDQQLGAADSDVQVLQKRLDDAATAQRAAHSLVQYRNVAQQAQAVANDAGALGQQLRQETTQIQRAADALKATTGGNLDAIHKAGSDALAQGRNDASVAAFMNKPGPFKGYDAILRASGRLERFAGQLGSGDLDQAAVAAAAAQRYSAQVHDGLLTGFPHKTIVISYQGQHLWAYEDGKVVQDTLVTTGRPQLPTDIGPMKVLRKSSPWKMHSPWPKESQWWYPDTVVQMVLWFTDTGEGLHDASWQPSGWGPGSQYGPYASHGCIHVQFGSEQFLFGWSDLGTPVIVYPGDGSPVSNQLAQITTDDQGNPLTGPKGA